MQVNNKQTISIFLIITLFILSFFLKFTELYSCWFCTCSKDYANGTQGQHPCILWRLSKARSTRKVLFRARRPHERDQSQRSHRLYLCISRYRRTAATATITTADTRNPTVVNAIGTRNDSHEHGRGAHPEHIVNHGINARQQQSKYRHIPIAITMDIKAAERHVTRHEARIEHRVALRFRQIVVAITATVAATGDKRAGCRHISNNDTTPRIGH